MVRGRIVQARPCLSQPRQRLLRRRRQAGEFRLELLVLQRLLRRVDRVINGADPGSPKQARPVHEISRGLVLQHGRVEAGEQRLALQRSPVIGLQ